MNKNEPILRSLATIEANILEKLTAQAKELGIYGCTIQYLAEELLFIYP